MKGHSYLSGWMLSVRGPSVVAGRRGQRDVPSFLVGGVNVEDETSPTGGYPGNRRVVPADLVIGTAIERATCQPGSRGM